MAWENLEHKVYALLKDQKDLQKVGLAVSGGVDSAVLFHALLRLSSALKWQLHLLHVHHGPSRDPEIQKFRKRGLEEVKAWGQESGLSVAIFKHPAPELSSEEAFRQVRRAALFEFQKSLKLDAVLTGHHQQDLLETRLIHLIRGSGGEGLKSLKFRSEIFLRPLLPIAKKEIEDYAAAFNLSFVEDPTNKDGSRSLRNWIRGEWLPGLELRRPGAVKTLAESLERVAGDLRAMQQDLGSTPAILAPGEWSRSHLLALEPRQLERALVLGLQALGSGHSFTQGQIREVAKRLDSSQKEYKFALRGQVWEVFPFKVKVTLKDL